MQTQQSVTDFYEVKGWQLYLASKCCDRVAPLLGITTLDRTEHPIAAFFHRPDVSLSTWLESFAHELSREEAVQALKTFSQLRSLPQWRILWVLSFLYLLALCMADEYASKSHPEHPDEKNSMPPTMHRNLSHMLLQGICYACGCALTSQSRKKDDSGSPASHLSDAHTTNGKPRAKKITQNAIAHCGVVALAASGVQVTHDNMRKRYEHASAPAWRGYYELGRWYSGGAKNLLHKIFLGSLYLATYIYLSAFALRWSFWLAHRLSVLHN